MSEERDRQIRNFISQLVLLDERSDDLLSQEELGEIVLELGYDEADLERLERTAQAHRTRGKNYAEVGELELAAREYAMALAMEPQDIPTQVEYARALYNLYKIERDDDDLKLARKLTKQCVSQDPEFRPAYELMGEMRRFTQPTPKRGAARRPSEDREGWGGQEEPALAAPQPKPAPVALRPAPAPTQVLPEEGALVAPDTAGEPAAKKPRPTTLPAKVTEPAAPSRELIAGEDAWADGTPRAAQDSKKSLVVAAAILGPLFLIVLFVLTISVSNRSSGFQDSDRSGFSRAQTAFQKRAELPYQLTAPEGVNLSVTLAAVPREDRQILRAFDLKNASYNRALKDLMVRVVLFDEDDRPFKTLRYPTPAAEGEEQDAAPLIRPGDTVRVGYPAGEYPEVWAAQRAQIIVDQAEPLVYESGEQDRKIPVRSRLGDRHVGDLFELWEREFKLPAEGEYPDDARLVVQPEFSIRQPRAGWDGESALRFNFFDRDGMQISSTLIKPLSDLPGLEFSRSTRPFRPTFELKGATRSYEVRLAQ